MKDIVIHVREDVCTKFNRDPEATRLIEVAREFGSVESLDSALTAERAKHQAVLDNLIAQHDARVRELETELDRIKERKVTDEELELLRAIRKKAAVEAAGYEKAIRDRDDQLEAIVAEQEARKEKIRALYGL